VRGIVSGRVKTLAAALVLLASPAFAEQVLGAQLPDQAKKVAELRYRTSQDWDDTMKYFRGVYPKEKYPRRDIINQPGVRAIHLANPNGKGWEGLNIYQANDEVRIFVVPSESMKPAKKTPPKKPGKK
jgi:hypothetical protein